MKIKNRVICIFVSALIAFLPITPVFAAQKTITLSNAKDVLKLSNKFKSDTYSENIVVELKRDIDLSDTKFSPIPYFNGIFNGNGHKITGYKIEKDMSYCGFFRYIGEKGTVNDTNFEGSVTPGGTREYVGGIAGQNMGRIKNCTFKGTVSGQKYTGGITGANTKTGKIEDSTSEGTVKGLNFTGGIAGHNMGSIVNCSNKGAVNITPEIRDNNAADTIKTDLKEEDFEKTELLNVSTDTGGIAGYSKGIILSCVNYSKIGYEHIGYNTGGIAGRQAGYISDCANYGIIYGRKDVGGISGQSEPFVILEYGDDYIEAIKNALNGITDVLTKNRDNKEISDALDKISERTNSITDKSRDISDDAQKYGKDMTKTMNELSDRMYSALDDSDAAIKNLEKMSKGFSDGFDDLEKFSNSMENIADGLKDAASKGSEAFYYFEKAGNCFEEAGDKLKNPNFDTGVSKIKEGINTLKNALSKKTSVADGAQETLEGVNILKKNISDLGTALSLLNDGFKNLEKAGKNQYTPKGLSDLITNIEDIKSGLSLIADGLKVLSDGFDINNLRSSLTLVSSGFKNITKGFRYMDKSLGKLSAVLGNKGTFQTLSDALSDFKSAMDYARQSADSLSSAVDKLKGDKKLSAPEISDAFSDKVSSLFDDISGLNGDFNQLRDGIKSEKNEISDSLYEVGMRLSDLSAALGNSYENASKLGDDIFVDASENYNSPDGKTEKCRNYGKINGDVNTGGITGSMAIEYDFDPEDDVTKSGAENLKFTYKTKAVLLSCENYGTVSGKNDYTGGIAGKMDLGSVVSCKGSGAVSSESGDYVGGIAGYSSAFIKNSLSKCSISGNNYTGGITGEGNVVENCFVISDIKEGNEFTGSVSGRDKNNSVKNCYYVDSPYGGIDGIDYKGVAEKTDFKNLEEFSEKQFGEEVTFTLTYVADGREIKKINFDYKEPISEKEIPEIPEKDGYYGVWDDFDYSCPKFDASINAEYFKTIELLKSDLKDGKKSVVMIVGKFDKDASVKAEKITKVPKSLYSKKIYASYEAEVSGTKDKNMSVRYLKQKKNSEIYVNENGKLRKASQKQVGSYAQFKVNSDKFEIYETAKNPLPTILKFAVPAVLIVLAFFFVKKEKLKKQSA